MIAERQAAVDALDHARVGVAPWACNQVASDRSESTCRSPPDHKSGERLLLDRNDRNITPPGASFRPIDEDVREILRDVVEARPIGFAETGGCRNDKRDPRRMIGCEFTEAFVGLARATA